MNADDPVGLRHTLTKELASMEVWRMRRALLCLAATAPAVAEAFLVRALTPAAAQLLTHRFEQADSLLLSTGPLCCPPPLFPLCSGRIPARQPSCV